MMVGICTAYGMFQDTITNRELCGKVGYVRCVWLVEVWLRIAM